MVNVILCGFQRNRGSIYYYKYILCDDAYTTCMFCVGPKHRAMKSVAVRCLLCGNSRESSSYNIYANIYESRKSILFETIYKMRNGVTRFRFCCHQHCALAMFWWSFRPIAAARVRNKLNSTNRSYTWTKFKHTDDATICGALYNCLFGRSEYLAMCTLMCAHKS